jgi:hypothetical protein
MLSQARGEEQPQQAASPAQEPLGAELIASPVSMTPPPAYQQPENSDAVAQATGQDQSQAAAPAPEALGAELIASPVSMTPPPAYRQPENSDKKSRKRKASAKACAAEPRPKRVPRKTMNLAFKSGNQVLAQSSLAKAEHIAARAAKTMGALPPVVQPPVSSHAPFAMPSGPRMGESLANHQHLCRSIWGDQVLDGSPAAVMPNLPLDFARGTVGQVGQLGGGFSDQAHGIPQPFDPNASLALPLAAASQGDLHGTEALKTYDHPGAVNSQVPFFNYDYTPDPRFDCNLNPSFPEPDESFYANFGPDVFDPNSGLAPQGTGPGANTFSPAADPYAASPHIQQQYPQQGGVLVNVFNQQPQGFNQQVQGFNPQVQGFNPQVQGFNPQVQGFNQQVQGFNTQAPGGFNQQVQGFNPQAQGFNLQGNGSIYQPNANNAGFNGSPQGHNKVVIDLTEDE